MIRAALRHVWLLLALLAACSSTETINTPTQVLLEVTCNDPELLARMDAVRVEVSSFESGGWRDAKPATFPITKFAWPLEVPIFPRKGSDESRQFQVIVQALQGDVVLAETRALARFAQGKHKRLSRELYFCPEDPGRICAPNDCRGEACKVCSKGGTCDDVDVLDTLPDGPTEADLDSGAGPDADAAMTGEGGAGQSMDGTLFDASGAKVADASANDASVMDASGDTGAMDANANDANTATDAGPSVDAASDSGVDAGLPACPSGTARCAQGCVTIDMSPMNCGRCGRTCRSNGCSAGACTPTSIYTHTPASADAGTSLGAIAIVPPFVYLTDPTSNVIQRVSTNGGTATLVSYMQPTDFGILGAFDGYLYGAPAFGGGIHRMPLSSDQFAIVPGTQGLSYIGQLTFNTSQLVVSWNLSSTHVQAIAKTGATELTSLANGPSLSSEIEADDSFVYVRDPGAIQRTSVVTLGTPSPVATFDVNEVCTSMLLAGDQLIFASSQRVAKAPKAGGTVTTLAARSADALTADATYVYYRHGLPDNTCSAGVELYRVPIAGGPSELLAKEPRACRDSFCCGGALLQDDTALYWIRGDGLAIRRVEK